MNLVETGGILLEFAHILGRLTGFFGGILVIGVTAAAVGGGTGMTGEMGDARRGDGATERRGRHDPRRGCQSSDGRA